MALGDAAGATKSARTVTVTGPATAAGTLALYVNGRRIATAVASGDTANEIAAAVASSVNAVANLPVTAAAAAAVVTLTHRHGGAATDLDVRVNFRAGEAVPAGTTAVVASTVAGAGDPDVGDAIDGLTDEQYNVIATAYSDDANMDALEEELQDRWGPLTQADGQAIAAFKGANGTQAEATTYGNGRNSLHSTVMDAGKSPTPNYLWAATVAGAAAASARRDPARPFQTLELEGVVAPPLGSRRNWTERNTLLHDGISTYGVDPDGTVRIERLITTYQTRNGEADTAYLNLNTPMTLSHIRAAFRSRMRTKYGRHKLADDGSRFDPGQPIMTPSLAKAEAMAWFEEMEGQGLVEGFAQFRRDLIVERNADNRDRLDILMPPDLVNQLRVVGVQIRFIL